MKSFGDVYRPPLCQAIAREESSEFAASAQPPFAKNPYTSTHQSDDVSKRTQRVEKLLRACARAPLRGLIPRFCSVLPLIPRCFGSVLDYRPVQQRLFQQPRPFRVHTVTGATTRHSKTCCRF